MKNPYAIGKRCYLRVPEEGDVDSNWYEWFSDPTVTKYLTDHFWPNTKEEQLRFVRRLVGDKNRLVLLVCSLDSVSPIGVVSLGQINFAHRYASFSFVVPPSLNGSAQITFEASKLLLDAAFFKMNLLNIRTFTASENMASIQMQKLLGFKVVGEFSEMYLIEGSPNNEICMQLKIEDWRTANNPLLRSR
jgi:RimJ/RimL family protein N-acetyltransferase